ncbi:hypothetical protein HK405_001702, partial [Cladochytrium tenue]
MRLTVVLIGLLGAAASAIAVPLAVPSPPDMPQQQQQQPLAAVGPDNGAGTAPVAAWDPLAAATAAATSSSSVNIPTVHDAAVTARRILRKTGHATFSTVFPAGDDDDDGRRRRRLPAGVAGVPIGLPDYVAD